MELINSNFYTILSETDHSSEYENSFTWKDWMRLRDTWNTIAASQTLIQRHSAQIESMASEENSYRNYASDLQNRQIRLRILERNTQMARELIRAARYRLSTVVAEIKHLRERSQMEEEQVSSLAIELAGQKERDQEQRLQLKQLCNELVFRRRHMLFGIYEIFFPRIKNCSRTLVFKKQCLCLKFDVIRGLHFPTIAARLAHNDMELSAAAGLLVQLLLAISQILFIPLKHLPNFHASRSSITNRISGHRFYLYSLSSKMNKNQQLDQAMHLLNECVVQLRTQSGVMTREGDRPIRLIQELLLSYIGNHRFPSSELLVPIDKFSTNNLFPSLAVYISVKPDKLVDDSALCNILIPLSV